MAPGMRDPWVAGEPIPGVTLAYNERVQIVSGPYAGQAGWLVTLTPGPDPVYTVELESGEPDVEVPQSMLRRTA